jgi:hypothetical protein
MYAAFRTPDVQHMEGLKTRWRLLTPLLLVVALQVTLLTYVTVAWKEKFTDMLSTSLAVLTAAFKNDAITSALLLGDPWSWLLLALTKISSVCTLALYTHAEVQAAVTLFDELQDGMHNVAVLDDQQPSCWTLLVPLLQLGVANYTLFVQGVLFQTYTVPTGISTTTHVNVLDAVLASVGLAFILEIDDRIWKLMQPVYENSQATDLLATLWAHLGFCCESCICCEVFWASVFTVLLFVYECTFGMLLILYSTEFTINLIADSSMPLAIAIVLGCLCFFGFQVVLGVQSKPAYARDADNDKRRFVRFVMLNLLAPLAVGVIARWACYDRLNWQTEASIWRCRVGAEIGCASCNTSSSWCSSTASCESNCGVTQVNGISECRSDWCRDATCINCLIANDATAMPTVRVNEAILADDTLPMCVRSGGHKWQWHRWYSCMQVWYSVVPAVAMLLFACAYLLLDWWCVSAPHCSCSFFQEHAAAAAAAPGGDGDAAADDAGAADMA